MPRDTIARPVCSWPQSRKSDWERRGHASRIPLGAFSRVPQSSRRSTAVEARFKPTRHRQKTKRAKEDRYVRSGVCDRDGRASDESGRLPEDISGLAATPRHRRSLCAAPPRPKNRAARRCGCELVHSNAADSFDIPWFCRNRHDADCTRTLGVAVLACCGRHPNKEE